jgi:hypothetical protein
MNSIHRSALYHAKGDLEKAGTEVTASSTEQVI